VAMSKWCAANPSNKSPQYVVQDVFPICAQATIKLALRNIVVVRRMLPGRKEECKLRAGTAWVKNFVQHWHVIS
jgi:hypothetical protein